MDVVSKCERQQSVTGESSTEEFAYKIQLTVERSNVRRKLAELNKESMRLETRLNEVQNLIRETKMSCQHEWVRHRESGLYGQKYYECSHCGSTRF